MSWIVPDAFAGSARVRALPVVHRIHLSDFYVKHKFSFGRNASSGYVLKRNYFGQVSFFDMTKIKDLVFLFYRLLHGSSSHRES